MTEKHHKLSQRKVAVLLLAVFLIMSLTMNTSLSYLIRERVRNNVFGLGRVELTLVEDSFPKEESQRLLSPKSVVPKNPHIVNTGTTREYVYLEVTVPYAKVLLVNDTGEQIHKPAFPERHDCELFDLVSTADSTVTGVETTDFTKDFTVTDNGHFEYENHWTFLRSTENLTDKTHTYLFGYDCLLMPDSGHNTTTNLFDHVQFRNILEGDLPENTLVSVVVNAYGIQSEELLNHITVADTEHITPQELRAIYRLYENQEGR